MLPSIISILLLGLLIIVHELGHYVLARWAGVRILRLSIGFGPRLLAWTRGHTEYAISAIPLGGYVKMAGEQEHDRTGKPWDYCAKPPATRAGIIVAGPVVNYLVACLSLWTVFLIGFPELLPVISTDPTYASGRTAGHLGAVGTSAPMPGRSCSRGKRVSRRPTTILCWRWPRAMPRCSRHAATWRARKTPFAVPRKWCSAPKSLRPNSSPPWK